jgi:hypothetical protein
VSVTALHGQYGTQVTTGLSGAKGAWTQLSASTPEDAKGVFLGFANASNGQLSWLNDVAVGAAASEVPFVENVLVGTGTQKTASLPGLYVPVGVVAGSRITGRNSVNTLSQLSLWFRVHMVGGANPTATTTTYGANEATERGALVDPGGSANTKGSYTELTASTVVEHDWVGIVMSGRGNIETGGSLHSVDLSAGAAGSEVVVFPDSNTASGSASISGDGWNPMWSGAPLEISSGTRLAARAACSITDATDRLIEVVAIASAGSQPVAGDPCKNGGEIVVVADPLDGEDFSTRVIEPEAWLTLGYDDQDRHFALNAYPHVPAYYGGRKQPFLVRFGGIARWLSTRASPYRVADALVEIDDAGRLLSSLEATSASEHWANREVAIRVASRATAAALGTPWTLLRGIWKEFRTTGLTATLGFRDVLGSEFSDLHLERTFPIRKLGDDFPEAPPEFHDRVVPIIYGAYRSDASSPVSGLAVARQAQPGSAPTNFAVTAVSGGSGGAGWRIYYQISAVVSGEETPLTGVKSVELTDTNRQVSGTWTAVAGASEIRVYSSQRSDFLQFAYTTLAGGATSFSDVLPLPNQNQDWMQQSADVGIAWQLGLRMNVTYWVAARLADGTYTRFVPASIIFTPLVSEDRRRYASLSWTQYAGNDGYRVIRHRSFYSNWGPVFDRQWDLAPDVNSLVDPITEAHSYVSSVDDPPQQIGQIPCLHGGPTDIAGDLWNRLIVARHPCTCFGRVDYTVKRLFEVEERREGEEDDRERDEQRREEPNVDPNTLLRVDDSAFGSTWLVPGKTGWPFATDYLDVNGYRYCVIYTKINPPPAQVFLDCNGVEDVGDGSGRTITNAARAAYHLLTNFVPTQDSDGWTSGAWLSPKEFVDGTPIVNSASFAAAETIQVSRMGGDEQGYRVNFYLQSQTTLRELFAMLLDQYDLHWGQNHHGQLIVNHLNEFVDLSSVIHLTDVIDLVDTTMINRALDGLENLIRYDWKYSPALDAYEVTDQERSDAIAMSDNRDRPAIGDHRHLMTRHEATASDVIGRSLARLMYPQRSVQITCTLRAVRVALGSIVTVDDFAGVGASGWVGRPLWVTGVETSLGTLDEPPTVRLTCVDVYRLVEGHGWVLGDRTALGTWTTATSEQRRRFLYLGDRQAGQFSDGSLIKRLS